MKMYLTILIVLCLTLAAGAQTKSRILSTDPLTGLPLSPSTDAGMGLGNEPTPMPGSNVCQSKMQAEFYLLYKTTTDAAAAWYTPKLAGFKMAKGTESGRTQVVFYKPDGTVLVIVTGDSGSPNAYSVAYQRYTPGLSEKTIIGASQGKVLCK